MGTRELRRLISEKKKQARSLLDINKIEEVEKLKGEIEDLKEELEEREEREREELKDLINQRDRISQREERALKNVVLPNEKLKEINKSKKTNMRLGKLVRGMAGKGWTGADEEAEYYRSMTSVNNTTIIPQDLSNKIIDVARTNSAIFGRIPTVPMESNNLTIAVQTKDPVAGFVNEGDPIVESGPVFTKVTMEGKTLAIFIPVSEQLLDSAANLDSQLMNSCAKAIALALDKALLYGKGKPLEEGTEEIKGISLYEDINKVTHTGATNYDMFIKGIKETKKSNINPTDVVYSTDTGMDLAMLKDTNGQYITKPISLNEYNFTESNNVKTTESYIYDYNSLLLGIHKGVKMEWGTSLDQFQRIMKGLRIYIRTDLAVVNPKGITQITINNV